MNTPALLEAVRRTLDSDVASEAWRRAEAALLQVLRSDPQLEIFDGRMQQMPSCVLLVALEDLSRWLVTRASAVGPDQAVADLDRYIAEDVFQVQDVSLLSGVTVNGRFEFFEGFVICPTEELAPSPLKDYAASAHFSGHTRPTAALVYERAQRKNHTPMDRPKMLLAPSGFGELEDARLILTLIKPIAPVSLAWWTGVPEWVPLGQWDIRWAASAVEGQAGWRTAELSEIELGKARELFRFFRQLPTAEKLHLRIPMNRLNRSLRRREPADSAIELGIALEALFFNDLDDDRGELTHRLRVRAARFLGGDLPERREIEKLVRQAYRLRSIAVHTGAVPDRVNGTPNAEVLEKCSALTARAIEKILRAGKSPNWLEIVLG